MADSMNYNPSIFRSFFSRENWTFRMSPVDRERDGDPDSTGSFYRRRYEDVNPTQIPPRRIEIPIGVIVTLVIYLIGQLVGSIWWAATLQSDMRYAQREDAKIWQKVETHDLQLGRLDSIVRNAVKEAMLDAGLRSNHHDREDR